MIVAVRITSVCVFVLQLKSIVNKKDQNLPVNIQPIEANGMEK